jgi:putative restriction endonuclease
MPSLADYCHQFSRLKRAPNTIFPELTLSRAPHKPFLLLAIMEMVARKELTNPFIGISEELTELTTLFTGYWRAVMPVTHTSSIAFPFSRLWTEPFWELIPVPGKTITREAVNAVTNVAQLRKLVLGAQLDEMLLLYMLGSQSRRELTLTLLQSCFSAEGQKIISAELSLQQQAFQYSVELEKRAHQVADLERPIEYPEAARDQGFRRAIVNSYDHRCALCGVRIVTPEGHTVVEAAHIRPWSKFKNDDLRNGMALCRLCHWAFDEGLMSVDDHYGVLISRQMATAPNAAGFLMTLSGRPIIRPVDTSLWPDTSNLAWHRQNVGVGLY